MKAILILDISNYNEKKYYAEIHIKHKQNHKKVKTFAHRNLKPIPKRLLILSHYQGNELLNSEEVAYAKGRNDCLDEILGEEV